MAGPLDLRFVSSYTRVDDLPHTAAELALVGRSNVGKSSLINALANRRALAKTSKTPGATRLLNGYELAPEGSGRWIIDLPGYGYAKASKADQRRWSTMIGEYLDRREPLRSVVHLIDAEVGPTALDIETRAWLAHLELPVSYVATKADKVRPSRSKKRRIELVDRLGVTKADVQWVSADKGSGIAELRARLTALLAA